MNNTHERIRALWNNNTMAFNKLLIACVKNEPNDLIEALKDPAADPTTKDHVLIKEAVISNNLEIVRILLDDGRIDPSIHDNFCLANGPHYDNPLTDNQQEIKNLLITDHRVIAKSIKLKQQWHNDDDIQMIKSNYPELLI